MKKIHDGNEKNVRGMFVAQAIFPDSTSSWGSLTSNNWILCAVSIALSSLILISVQCSRVVVEVFLLAHCMFTGGLVIPTRSINTRVVEILHAFFGRQLRAVFPINLANAVIVTIEGNLKVAIKQKAEQHYTTRLTKRPLVNCATVGPGSNVKNDIIAPHFLSLLEKADGVKLVTSDVTAMSSTDLWRTSFSRPFWILWCWTRPCEILSLAFDMWYECLPPFVIIGACIAVTGWGLKICDRLFQEGKVFINNKVLNIWTWICMHIWPVYLCDLDDQRVKFPHSPILL